MRLCPCSSPKHDKTHASHRRAFHCCDSLLRCDLPVCWDLCHQGQLRNDKLTFGLVDELGYNLAPYFFGAQRWGHDLEVGKRQSARSARSSLAEDSEPRRASRRQSKDWSRQGPCMKNGHIWMIMDGKQIRYMLFYFIIWDADSVRQILFFKCFFLRISWRGGSPSSEIILFIFIIWDMVDPMRILNDENYFRWWLSLKLFGQNIGAERGRLKIAAGTRWNTREKWWNMWRGLRCCGGRGYTNLRNYMKLFRWGLSCIRK